MTGILLGVALLIWGAFESPSMNSLDIGGWGLVFGSIAVLVIRHHIRKAAQ